MSNTTDSSGSVDAVRRQLLDGLMAADATAWEHSLYRTRLYAGYEDPCESWVPRAHASMRERAGDWRAAPDEARDLPYNRQVSLAAASIPKRGWWERRRRRNGDAEDGPHTPWETRLCDCFAGERTPARSTLAYAAIKSLSLHVSPLGPERELALCRVWYEVGRDNTLMGTRKQWAGWLGCKSERWAVRWLRDLAAADVGVELEVLPPSGSQRAKLYIVRLTLPPIERMVRPNGGARHSELEEAMYQRFREWAMSQGTFRASERVVSAQAPVPTSAPTAEDRTPLPTAPLYADDDYDLPWDDDEDDDDAPTDADETTDDDGRPAGGDTQQPPSAQAPLPAGAAEPGLTAPDLLGVQLHLDGSDGQRLVRLSDGALRYEGAPGPAAVVS